MISSALFRALTALSCLCLLLTSLAPTAQAQFADWRSFHNSGAVNSVALEGSKLWASSIKGGLTMIDRATGSTTFYNRTNSGLPTNAVSRVVVDAQGRKWIATRGGGLARLDGSTWTVFTRQNSPLPEDDLLSLFVDSQGRVWVGTNFGVARFDGAAWAVYTAAQELALEEPVMSISQDAAGNMWFGTWANQLGDGGHLIRFDGSTWQSYHHANSGLPQGDINHVAHDGRGRLWISFVGQGLAVFDGNNTWQRYHAGNSGLRNNNINHVAFGVGGLAWVSTAGGLYTFDGTTWAVYNRLNSDLQTAWVSMTALDAAGNPYVAAAPGAATPGGIYHFANGAWQHFNTSNSGLLYNSEIADIAAAPGNTLWLATRAGGLGQSALLRLAGNTWAVFDSANSPLPHNDVNTVEVSPDGSVWVGTNIDRAGPTAPWEGGLARFDGTSWTVYPVEQNGLPLCMINDLAFEGAGTRWLGTNYGLVKFDANGFTHWHSGNSGLPDNAVEAVAVDAQGVKWAATYGGGLVRFDGSTWQTFNQQNSALPSNNATSVLAATDGSIWVGTWQGLARLHNGSWTVYAVGSGLPSSKIHVVRQAPNGRIWVGTEEGGAAEFDGQNWRTYGGTATPVGDVRVSALAFQGNTVWLGNESLFAYDATVTSTRSPRRDAAAAAMLYPNPTRGTVSVRAEAGAYHQAEVFNSLGQLVRSVRVQGTTLDLAQLPAGLYQVRLSGRQGRHTTKLLVE